MTGRFLLLLGLTPLICRQAAATCYGNACPEQHETATAQGLLGDSLNAVAAANQCNNKSYTALEPELTDTPILDLRWTGPLKFDDKAFDQYVFAITEGQGGFIGGPMWRSGDWGRTWHDITKKMAGAIEGPIAEEGVIDIIYHWSSPHHLLFLGPGFHLWTSNDFGDTFTELDTPGRTLGFWVDIRPHPNQHDWLLARVRRNECLKYDGDTSKWCANDLFLSQDFAVTWTNLTANSNGRIAAFWDYDWGANMLHWNTSAGWKDETILATLYEDPDHLQGPYPGWDPNLHFVASHDFFTSDHEKIAPCGNQFEILAHKIFLAMPASCSQAPDGSKRTVPKDATARNAVALYISEDEAMTYTEACLPTGLLDQGYNLIRTHDGAGVFAIVDHDERDEVSARAPMGSAYASGWNTSLFTFSMDRNYRREYLTDFVRIEWLPGGYMANQLSQEVFMNPDMMRRTGKSYEDFIQTKITFNGGAQWSDLETPEIYTNQVCNQCKGMQDPSKCKLHLHGPTNWYSGPGARPSFYSHMSAPGFIMASGNTGEHLDFAADTTCTWLSSDGGLTWQDVAAHTAIYEFGDHGSIVLLARHEAESPTDYVRFSTDYGKCWHRIDLPKALDVQNIRLEPSGKSHVFAVHGQECRKTDAHPKCTMDRSTPGWPKGMLYMLDIMDILKQGGKEWPECADTDYEPWSGPKPEMCQLGRNHTWSRVKPDVDCYNGKGWRGTLLDVTPCFCNHEDLECEYGYERRAGNSTCEPMQGIDPQQCPIIATGQYYISESHLRLLHNDTCQQVERVLLDSDGQGHCVGDKCPGNQHPGGHGERSHWVRTTFVLLLLVAGAVGAFFWWTRFASDSLKATIEESGAPVLACLGGCAGWVQDKFAQLTGRQRREAEGAYYDPLSGGDGGLNLDEEDARSPPLFPMGGGR